MSEKERREGAEKIFRALSSVDEELLERSENEKMSDRAKDRDGTQKKVTRIVPYSGAFAACICLCVVAGVLFKTGVIPQNSKSERPETAKREETTYDVEVAAALDDTALTADAGEKMTEDAIQEEMAEAAAEDAAGQEFSSSESSSSESSSSESSSSEGLTSGSGAGGQQEKQPDMAPYEEDMQCQQITEEQARETENLGAYLPTVLPEKFAFTEAYCTEKTGSPTKLTMCWSRGEDNIVIGVLAPDSYELDQACVADLSRPETYDVNLYDTPYADTVPEAYYAIFDNPIFKRNELSETVVQARLKKIENSQDSSTDVETLGGNFRVLYEDGTMVIFNGCGSAKDVYRMFLSMEKTK